MRLCDVTADGRRRGGVSRGDGPGRPPRELLRRAWRFARLLGSRIRGRDCARPYPRDQRVGGGARDGAQVGAGGRGGNGRAGLGDAGT